MDAQARFKTHWRRAPPRSVLAIGRDVYLDTDLHLPKLEALDVPRARLGGTSPEQKAFGRLLSAYVNDRGMFGTMALLLPEDLPLMKDPNFLKDREDFFDSTNYKRDAQSRREQRLTSLRKVADEFTGAQFSAKVYPQVFACIDRLRVAFEAAPARNKPRTLSGEVAAAEITQAAWHEAGGAVDAHDFEVADLGLKKGDAVTVGPTDFGTSCRDAAVLVGLSSQGVVIEAKAGQSTVRIHAPRQQFSIKKA